MTLGSLASAARPISARTWAGAVLVDASVWIDHFRGNATPAAQCLAGWLDEEPERIVMSGVVACELLRGMRDDAAADALQGALDELPQADDLQRADWLLSAALFRRCRGAGCTVRSALDCLIAAHAIRLEIPLLVSDHDFDAIAAHSGLALYAPGNASERAA